MEAETRYDITMKAFVMCGAPGSGKSTYVSDLRAKYPDAVVISGDDIREELYGDASVQGDYNRIHDRMVEMLEESVGSTIIMDSTHYRAAYRKSVIALLNSFGYSDIEAVVVNRPLEVCLRQNASRDRKVPQYVIEKMHNSLKNSIRGINNEGFSAVQFV